MELPGPQDGPTPSQPPFIHRHRLQAHKKVSLPHPLQLLLTIELLLIGAKSNSHGLQETKP